MIYIFMTWKFVIFYADTRVKIASLQGQGHCDGLSCKFY